MSRSLKQKLLLSLAVGAILFVLLITRPWYAPTVVNFSQVPVGATVTVHLEDSWGREVRKTYDPARQDKSVEFNAARVSAIEADVPGALSINLRWGGLTVPYTSTKKITVDHSPPSRRWTLATAEAMVLFCGLFSIILFLLMCEWEITKAWPRKSKLWFSVIALGICVIGVLVTPGFFGWDIVANFVSAARYESSPFTGRFYSYLFAAGFQLFPVLWLVTAVNVLVTVICLYHIFSFAQRRGLESYFTVMAMLFLCYPGNFYMTYFPSRDLAAFWCFVMALLKLYEIWLEDDRRWLSYAWLVFFATCAIILRQEALLPVGALLLYEFFKQRKNHQKFFWLVLMIPVLSWVTLTFILRDKTLENDFYESTILVNPLSSILTAKYGNQLPAEVNQKLGPFFKNEYLLTRHNPIDIDPFHFGGLNRKDATHADYLRFRSAAIDIIRDNPSLFVENRWVLNQTMMGLGSNIKRYMFTEDSYFVRRTPEMGQMFESLPLQDYQRWPWVEACLQWWRKVMLSHQEIYFQSYLIPLVLWMSWFLISKSRYFVILSLALLVRTLLVATMAPAAYYKYQLPLWMFVPFALVYVLAEKRQASSAEASSHSA